jgi:hypothetical protein
VVIHVGNPLGAYGTERRLNVSDVMTFKSARTMQGNEGQLV